MNDDQLEKLLHAADEPPRLPLAQDFAARVRARQAQRRRARRRRLVLAVPALLGLFVLAGWQIALRESARTNDVAQSASANVPPPGSTGVSPVQSLGSPGDSLAERQRHPDAAPESIATSNLLADDAELAALVAEAEFHERLARRMIDDRRQAEEFARRASRDWRRQPAGPRADRDRGLPDDLRGRRPPPGDEARGRSHGHLRKSSPPVP